MKLRQKSKRDQALDAVASIAKTWSEWRLGDKVSKTTSTASKKATKHAEKASKAASKHAARASKQAKKQAAKASVPDVAKRKPVRIAAVVALVGGIGAAAAKKLTGGKAEPLYTPPGPAPDMDAPPPSPVAVEDLAKDPTAGDKPSVPPTVEPALTASTEVPPRDPSPVVLEDLASEAPAEPESGTEDGDAPAEDAPSDELAAESDDDSETADDEEAAEKPA